MLEQMRDSSGSLIIWVLFAIIIAAFVLFFGSPADSLGCGSTKEYSIEVKDEQVPVNSWRFAYNGIPYVFGTVPGDQRKPMALELLLQRELLAQAAADMEFKVSGKLVDEAITGGDFFIMGNRLDGSNIYFNNEDPKYPFFDYEYLENLVRGRLGLPNVDAYKREQRRELMAQFMKRELLQSAYVSDEEARQNFIQSNTTVSAEYVKFEVSKYRANITLSESEVQSYAAEHAEDLKAEWEQVKPRWESEKPRVRARIIKVARTQPAPAKAAPAKAAPEGEAPEKSPEEGAEGEPPVEEESAAPVTAEPIAADPALAVIEAARAKIAAGSDFASVAMETSQDKSASLGGSIGWRSADSMGYGQEVVDASKDLEIGKVSDVIEGSGAFYLVLIEERSDKGLTFDQKKLDLAAKAAPDAIAKERARAAAEAALLAASTSSLEELFPKSADPLTPEQLKKLMERSAPKGETGALYVEGANRLAQAGGAPAEPAAPTAAPAAKAAAKPKATAASAAAIAKPVAQPKPAATSAKEPALPPAKERAAIADGNAAAIGAPKTPADDEVPPPSVQSFVGTTRNGDFIAGLGRSKELVNALFGELGADTLAPQVYEVSESEGFVVIKLTDRSEADMEQFKEQASSLKETLAVAKGGAIMSSWLAERCLKLKASGAIQPNFSLLAVGDNKRIGYEPCSMLTATE